MSSEGIETALRKMRHLPAAVKDWQVETGEDSTGDPAVWVWVTLEDDADFAVRQRLRTSVRDAVHRNLRRTEPWVYVRFRGASEIEEWAYTRTSSLKHATSPIGNGRSLGKRASAAQSSAYYALFHLLVDEAANRLVTGPNRTALRAALARAFVHGDMKEAAQGFANSNPSAKVRPALATLKLPPQLVSVAAAFVDLQQARHEADYDTGRRFTRQVALDLVEQAEKAFGDWQVVRQSVQADTFLIALLVQKQLRS
jgi:hypothetical protein